MASDEVLREGVRQNLSAWIEKLECGGDLEKQNYYKKKFIHRLKTSPIAIEIDKANEQHYEVPTEFYLTSLGKRLKYSGCYFPDGVKDLDQAEDLSLSMYCDRAKIQDGQTVLDLGCGWGSFGLFVCEKFPRCQVTCVSNSNTQREHILNEAAKRGYGSRLDCITADANYFTTSKRFDRIVSIEMFEHMKNYELLFQRVSTWLKPAGLLFIQIFCHRAHSYAFDTKPGADTEWMAKNFFSGGTMPSVDLFLHFQNNISIDDHWVLNGTHYSKTLEAWLEKMDANKDKVKQIFSKAYGEDADKQIFNFRLFFIFCSEVFGFKNGNEWLIAQYLFRKKIPSKF